jgi:general secretion pathway protein G
MTRYRNAFTLVEVLIVVVILGILASIVVPQFAGATSDAQQSAMADQIGKIRRAMAVYYVRNGNVYPTITAGDGTWGEMLSPTSPYMRKPPVNMWIGGVNAKVIVIGVAPDSAFQTDHGWIYNPVTGDVWAGGFDGDDKPYPRP